MLLYPLRTRSTRVWCLDLTAPRADPSDEGLASVYGLIVPHPHPGAVYIGSTNWLQRRIRLHLSRSRTDLARAGQKGHRLRNTASTVLLPVVKDQCALLAVRLEQLPEDADRATLKRHELAWMLVATREALPLIRRRGPSIEWEGRPDDLRAAFRLARCRHWPVEWITALRPLCLNRALPRQSLAAPRRRPSARRSRS